MSRRRNRLARLQSRHPDHEPVEQPTRTLWFARSVLAEIALTIGVWRAERGGMLGGDLETGVIRHYHYDAEAHRTRGSYTPDHEELTRVLRDAWNPVDIRLLGFVHSHPPGLTEPSYGDVDYAQEILDHITDLPFLVMPIVRTARDGQFRVFPYVIHRGDDREDPVEECRFGLVDDEPFPTPARTEDDEDEEHGETERGANGHAVQVNGFDAAELDTTTTSTMVAAEPTVAFARPVTTEPIVGPGYVGSELETTFQRVTGAYDLELLSESRVVAVGAGGAATFLEELARAGVGEFVLIDPDVVAETNLATQQTYRRDVGRSKVDAIRERIVDVNPRAIVLPIRRSLDDLDDTTMSRLCLMPLRHYQGRVPTRWGLPGTTVPIDVHQRPRRTLLALLTDSFPAQARGNRLALNLGLPYLAAQLYAEGCGAEVVFSEPSVTPACTRCALRSRYEAYLEQSFENDVTSDGTPIFATGRLNALKGFLALALLHHGSNHPRWGDLLTRIGNRNLVQIRMHPDAPLPAFERVFAGADPDRVLFDDVVWLPQEPDCEATGYDPCPDCGGTGDLRNAIGTITDSHL